jgi:hypothetical protein
MSLWDVLNGRKTYLAAAGLFGLALYQFSQADYPHAVQTFCAALGTLGLRHAIDKQGTSAVPTSTAVQPR